MSEQEGGEQTRRLRRITSTSEAISGLHGKRRRSGSSVVAGSPGEAARIQKAIAEGGGEVPVSVGPDGVVRVFNPPSGKK